MTSFVFIQPHLRFGGAERQTVLVANSLASRGHQVSLILHSASEGLVSDVDPQVTVHDLGLESHLATIDVSRRMYKFLRKMPASIVIVKLWSSILACALIDKMPGVRHHTFNYCEDLDPSDHAQFIRLGAIKQAVIKQIFSNRPYLSANTKTVADSMVETYNLKQRPTVIPSTVEPTAVVNLAAKDPRPLEDGIKVVSVGSLIHRKGLDLIRDALAALDQPINWHVVGNGPMRAELEAYVDPRGQLKIHVHSGTSNPYGYMASADLLVHGARSEAWGIVLLEAMAVGTPVLAANAIGPTEMQKRLGHRPEILTTFDPTAFGELQKELRRALSLPKVPLSIAHAYIAPFTLEHAVNLWEIRADELMGCS